MRNENDRSPTCKSDLGGSHSRTLVCARYRNRLVQGQMARNRMCHFRQQLQTPDHAQFHSVHVVSSSGQGVENGLRSSIALSFCFLTQHHQMYALFSSFHNSKCLEDDHRGHERSKDPRRSQSYRRALKGR